MPATIKTTEIEPLITKVKDTDKQLTSADRTKVGDLLDAMGATIAVLNDQVESIRFSLEIWKDGATAAATSRSAALNALRMIAPPVANIEIDKALEDAAKLRQDVEKSTNLAKVVAAGARFAVKVAGKFV
jgi:hypothetical protein